MSPDLRSDYKTVVADAYGECGEVANLYRRIGLCPGCHRQRCLSLDASLYTLLQFFRSLRSRRCSSSKFKSDYIPKQGNNSHQLDLFAF